MGGRRGEGRFERAGSADLREVGLPAREARRLRIEHAWARAAGEAVGRRARASDVKRGILEIDVDDRTWLVELRPLLPRVVARIAREFPELGVRKFRLRLEGSVLEGARPVVSDEAAEPPGTAPAPRSFEGEETPRPATVTEGDLLEIARRYLERGRERRR